MNKTLAAAAMLALLCVGCDSSEIGHTAKPSASGSSSGGSDEQPTPQEFARACSWAVASDPDLVNVAYPDTAAQYWNAIVPIPPGGEVVIEGDYPHARYMSFNLYNPTLASFEGIADFEIQPDEGSVNPFLAGADRNVEPRHYSLHVVSGPPPEDPAQRQPNTLYAAFSPAPVAAYANIIYRIYVSDRGTSLAGNVDLPTFRFLLPGGQSIDPEAPCAALEMTRLGLGINDTLAELDLSAVPVGGASTDPLIWRRFVSAPISLAYLAQGYLDQAGLELPIWDPIRDALFATGLTGGFLSNRDNSYVSSIVNKAFGETAVILARAPRVPHTYENAARMDDADLRYWSLCTNDAPSQRYWDCLYDEQVPVDGDGNFAIVISPADRRPRNARPECGIAWLNWGPTASSLLILRNMLPDPGFPHAIQSVPLGSDSEREVMADYYPSGTYSSVAEFEALSADPAGGPDQCRPDLSTLRTRAQTPSS